MPRETDFNLVMVERAVVSLGKLADELTLVGGCAASLLATDPAAPVVRPTIDVDLVVEAATYGEWNAVGRKLKALGFQQGGVEGDPICRWRKEDLVIDVMPLAESVLGFSNVWYGSAIKHRILHQLPSGLRVHHVDAPHFVATKLAAFLSRGEGDVLASHDIEDIVRVVDGRPALPVELERAPAELRQFVRVELGSVCRDRFFAEAMPAFFGSGPEAAARARFVQEVLMIMTQTE